MFHCVTRRGSQVRRGHRDFQVKRDKKVKRSVEMVSISNSVQHAGGEKG